VASFVRIASALALFVLWHSPLAQAADDVHVREERLERELRRDPESRTLRLSLAKVLHFRGVDGDAAAERRSAELLERLTAEKPDDAVAVAYLGSARLVFARLAWVPWQKISLVRQGLDLLDRAVTLDPRDPEVRFMRGASTRPLPRYFGRGDQSAKDLTEAVAKTKDALAKGRLDEELAAAIFYLYGFTLLDHDDRAGTLDAWRTAVEIGPETEAGRKAAGRLAAARWTDYSGFRSSE